MRNYVQILAQKVPGTSFIGFLTVYIATEYKKLYDRVKRYNSAGGITISNSITKQ